MNLREYQAKALTTAMFPPERGLEYCTLGLVGEVAELVDVITTGGDRSDDDIAAEWADCAWYAAVLSHVAGIEVPSIDAAAIEILGNRAAALNTLVVHSGLIANKVKKVIRDGKPLDKLWLTEELLFIWRALASFCAVHELSINDALQANLDKLASRKARGVITGSGDKR